MATTVIRTKQIGDLLIQVITVYLPRAEAINLQTYQVYNEGSTILKTSVSFSSETAATAAFDRTCKSLNQPRG